MKRLVMVSDAGVLRYVGIVICFTIVPCWAFRSRLGKSRCGIRLFSSSFARRHRIGKFARHVFSVVSCALATAGPALCAAGDAPPLESRYPGGFFSPGAAMVFSRNGLPFRVMFTRQQFSERDVAILRDYPTIAELWLNRKVVQSSWLTHISGLTALSFLSLEGASIDDSGLTHLVGLPHLQQLRLDWCTKVTPEGMTSVAKLLNLEDLSLHGVKIGDKGLSTLRPLRKLRVLELERTGITDDGLELLREFHGLKRVAISPFPGESPSQEAIARFQASLPQVQIISGLWPAEMEALQKRTSTKGPPRPSSFSVPKSDTETRTAIVHPTEHE